MSDSIDGLPVPPRKRGAVPPPPHSADDAPAPVDVPRMEPPPPSLEAMIKSTRSAPAAERSMRWLLVLVMVAMAVAATSYVMR